MSPEMMTVGDLIALMRRDAEAGNGVQLGPTALRELLALHDEMLLALRTSAGNVRSLGPAGAIDCAPSSPYHLWLAMLEQAIRHAEETTR